MPLETMPMGLWEGALFNNVNAFLILMIILSGAIGVFSGYASIGAYGSFIIFTHVASQVELWIFNSLLYVVLSIVFVVMAMQVWQYINSSGGASPP